MNLPDKLAFLRKAKGLCQQELADEMNVTRQAISKWESGNVVPNLDNLIYLSKLYGVTIDSLIDDSQDLPPEPAPPEPAPPEPVPAEPVPPESPRMEHPAFPFIRKYGWLTAFLLAMVVILILVACLLNMRRLSEDHVYSFQEVSTCREDDDDGYSKGTFSLDGF